MPQVTLYKMNGEILLTMDVKKVEHSEGALVLHVEREAARLYGSRVVTNLPYIVGSSPEKIEG